MIIVKIFEDDKQIDELQIVLVGGGLQGLGGPTGAYDYKLLKPKHDDMPVITHMLEEGHLVLIAKALIGFLNVSFKKPSNIIDFPQVRI